LLGILRRRVGDADAFGLLTKIVESYSTTEGKGIPIGN
jgi:hypothetical protein